MKRSLALLAFAGAFAVASAPFAVAGAKNAIRVGEIQVLKSSEMAWRTIMAAPIGTSMNKTLQMNVSLECGLYTSTVVKSQNMVTDTSSAFAGVMVRVLVDGKEAQPGQVVFCNRMQQLTAQLQGALLSCTDMLNMSTCLTSPEMIGLLQETMTANSFNFALTMPTGKHNVEVQAKIHTDLSFQNGTAAANATIGKGAITIEEVNLIPDGNIISF
ncbi:MAG: hypothetical protein NDJ90_10745 [Oligoflexia bacterium]|nr:hypothetical protein [Oligoflexia bacterium]